MFKTVILGIVLIILFEILRVKLTVDEILKKIEREEAKQT